MTLQYPRYIIFHYSSEGIQKKITFICSNHVNLFITFNFRLNTHFFSFAWKIKPWEVVPAITSAIGTTQPEKNEQHQQKVIEMMTIWKKYYILLRVSEANEVPISSRIWVALTTFIPKILK